MGKRREKNSQKQEVCNFSHFMHKINELIIIVSIQVKTKPTQKNFKRGKDPSLRTLNKKFHHLDIMIHVKSNKLSKISTINKCRSIQMESAASKVEPEHVSHKIKDKSTMWYNIIMCIFHLPDAFNGFPQECY